MNTATKPGHPGTITSAFPVCTALPLIRIVPRAAPIHTSSTSDGGTGNVGLGRCRTSVMWWKASCRISRSAELFAVSVNDSSAQCTTEFWIWYTWAMVCSGVGEGRVRARLHISDGLASERAKNRSIKLVTRT